MTEKEDSAPDGKPGLKNRGIKTYVLRKGRMTQAQKRDYAELSPLWCIPYSEEKLNLIDIFGNSNPVVVEIGFGMGAATAEIASMNPDMNYIGIEVHTPGVGSLLGEIRSRDLKNLYIIEHDAVEVLENMIGDSCVSGFHVFFPDPWQKKKHHKRRLLKRPNTDLLARKLSKDGYIYFVTDWKEYADFALDELSKTEGIRNRYDGFAEAQDWRPLTKFECKGLLAERPITELYFLKD